jgi:hypothetical protein
VLLFLTLSLKNRAKNRFGLLVKAVGSRKMEELALAAEREPERLERRVGQLPNLPHPLTDM